MDVSAWFAPRREVRHQSQIATDVRPEAIINAPVARNR
jgi:hypothetical protein